MSVIVRVFHKIQANKIAKVVLCPHTEFTRSKT